MDKILIATIAALCLAVPTLAQDLSVVTVPEIGVETTVAAGGDVFSYAHVYTIDGYKTNVPSRPSGWFGLGAQDVPADTMLVPVYTSRAAKGCVPFAGTLEANGPCFIDDDGDGTFDRTAADKATTANKLKAPLPYSASKISISREDSFKRVVLFQGATSDSLKFSYREFKNDMARPAFTEELSIPREPFPAMIMVKNLQMEVLGVSGMGLRYRIVQVR
jgi:hypothetical protein